MVNHLYPRCVHSTLRDLFSELRPQKVGFFYFLGNAWVVNSGIRLSSSNISRHDGAGALDVAPSNVMRPGTRRISAAFIAQLCHHWVSDLQNVRQTTVEPLRDSRHAFFIHLPISLPYGGLSQMGLLPTSSDHETLSASSSSVRYVAHFAFSEEAAASRAKLNSSFSTLKRLHGVAQSCFAEEKSFSLLQGVSCSVISWPYRLY